MWIFLPHEGEVDEDEGKTRSWWKMEGKEFGGGLILNLYEILWNFIKS